MKRTTTMISFLVSAIHVNSTVQ